MADIFNMADVWNAGGTTFTAIKMDVTDTASAAASLLMDLQVGGATRFNVSKSGLATSAAGYVAGVKVQIDTGLPGLSMALEGSVAWSSTANYFNTKDLILLRDAANTLAQRNAANAQAFRLYNTYTDASNYERAVFGWSANTLNISMESAGTGSPRNIRMVSGSSAGQLLFVTNNIDRLVITGGGLLGIGGATASFPALKRSTTVLQARLADDSAFAPLQGALRTDANAATGLSAGALAATTNASIVLYDASGQAYRIPCII